MIKSQLRVKQNCLPSIPYQTLQTSKMNFENPLGEHVFKNNNCVRFSLLQLCPSVLHFVLAALFIPSENVLSGYFVVSRSRRKKTTFCDATTGFSAKGRLRNERRNSILMTRQYPDLGTASDWSCRVGNLLQPIKSTTYI